MDANALSCPSSDFGWFPNNGNSCLKWYQGNQALPSRKQHRKGYLGFNL
jgi:hypothetical protein